MRVDAGLAGECHRLAQPLNHRGGEKVAAELHEIGSLRRLGDDEGPFPDRIEERCGSFDRIRRTGGNDEELARGGDIGAAEYGRRHETLARVRVGRLKPLREGDTDGARGNMDRGRGQAADDATSAEHDALDGIVVCPRGRQDREPDTECDRRSGSCS